MIDDFQVPDEFLGAFRRLVRSMPFELQTDEAFLQTLVMYLKLGGEKLARQRVEVEKAEFVKVFTIVKRQPAEENQDNESDDDDEDSDNADKSDDIMDSDDAVDELKAVPFVLLVSGSHYIAISLHRTFFLCLVKGRVVPWMPWHCETS